MKNCWKDWLSEGWIVVSVAGTSGVEVPVDMLVNAYGKGRSQAARRS